MHLQDQLRDACCRLANVIEDIDKTDVCCARLLFTYTALLSYLLTYFGII